MSDQEILRKMGLSEHELKDLLRKFNDFVNTLNPAQRRRFLKSQMTVEEGVEELDKDVTAPQLEDFFRRHGPPGGVFCFMCDEDDLHHKHK